MRAIPLPRASVLQTTPRWSTAMSVGSSGGCGAFAVCLPPGMSATWRVLCARSAAGVRRAMASAPDSVSQWSPAASIA
jgi:hypothetical protein